MKKFFDNVFYDYFYPYLKINTYRVLRVTAQPCRERDVDKLEGAARVEGLTWYVQENQIDNNNTQLV